ncbi:PPPDE putative peptidase domain-containing protein [Diplogelasinospora grovesii]|uniref:PPPDE putative peptidase domain-containing protein n=1 Tax=Diplogelasinospora grovesii TaxID=303347 RepID=A0AAN6N996_9PEZI|nr:PPPDE putative peptidase domain-containing protein [Diplogelasinospora grovesii]
MPSRTPSKKSQRPARASHRSTLSLQKTEILINVYDLLPPGRLSSTLWFLGTSLLHSGVVINGKEYAYGGHDRRGITGVYWTKPKTEPPGGTFKCEILHGFTLASQSEIDSIIRDVSEEFLGTAYNLLTKNCNHFTAHLCQKLTGRPGPGWLNRAASIGVALPCVVPRDWIETPDFENTPDGALLDNTEDDEGELHADERSRMLRSSSEQPHLINPKTNNRQKSGRDDDDAWNSDDERRRGGSGKGKGKPTAKRDSAGRTLPASERAPTR